MRRLSLFKKLFCSINHSAKLYPAAILLLGLLTGIISAQSNQHYIFQLLLLLGVPFLSFWVLGSRQSILLMIFVVIGVLSVDVNKADARKRIIAGMSGDVAGVSATVEITDSACFGSEIKWLPNPGLVRAKLLEYSLNDGIRRKPESQTEVALRLPKNTAIVKYGDVLQLSGRFELPSGPQEVISQKVYVKIAFPKKRSLPGFDLQKYMKVRGLSALLRTDEVVVTRQQKSWFSTLLNLRTYLLSRAAVPLNNDSDRALLAALTFGCRQGLNKQSRQAFIRSGTVHLFTVSGMHVGILALLLWLILRPLPFKIRYLVAPAVLLIYVLMTGANPPAVRAFLMIALWSVFRAFSLRTPVLNVVYVTATALLIYNPLYLESMGFQFSFIVTGFLLAAGHRISHGTGFIGEHRRWIPPSERGLPGGIWNRMRRSLAMAGSGCFAAWFAGCGICLYNQGLFVPAAVGANLLIMPLVWLLYPLTFLMTIFSGTIISFWLGSVVGVILNLMSGIGEAFQAFSSMFACPRPPFFSLLIFYFGLLLLASARTRRWFTCGMGITLATVLFWHLRVFAMSDSVTVFYGGSATTPSALICSPATGRAVMIDVPSYDAGYAAAGILREKGIAELNVVAFSSSSAECSRGIEPLALSVKVATILPPARVYSRSNLSKFINKYERSGGALLPYRKSNLCAGMKIFANKNCKSAEYQLLYRNAATVKVTLKAVGNTGNWSWDKYIFSRCTPMLIKEFEYNRD